MAEFTFGQVEAVLADVSWVAPHKRVAFAGRLKFLQKNGVPIRDAPGRGKAGLYSFDNLLQLAVAVELLQCGLTPQRAAAVVTRNWWLRLNEILSVLLVWREAEAANPTGKRSRVRLPWVWQSRVEALSELLQDRPESHTFALLASRRATLGELEDENGAPYSRSIMIDPGWLISRVLWSVCSRHRFATIDSLIDEISGREPHLDEFARRFLAQMERGIDFYSKDETYRSQVKAEVAAYNDAGQPDSSQLRALLRHIEFCMSRPGKMRLGYLLESKRARFTWTRDDSPEAREAWTRAMQELVEFGIISAIPEWENEGQAQLTTFGRHFAEFWDDYIGWEAPGVDQEA